MTRKPWIGGNWKCNGTINSIKELTAALSKVDFDKNKVDVVICPTALHMKDAKDNLPERIQIASQNVSKTGEGAYTGEISVGMLKDGGYNWTLVGHSERRQYYGETDAIVGDKVAACQKGGINVVICIGEVLEERQNGTMKEVLTRQVEAFISKITDWSKVVIAYEPVWAIGTGVVATPEQAQEAHQIIRSLIKEKVGVKESEAIRIVYGGSVNEKNCSSLICLPDVDGFLVGGASLKPAFGDIIKCAI